MFACLNAYVHGVNVADVVLSCAFIEEGGAMTGAHFTRTPSTLVLRDLRMDSEQSPETITPYKPPDSPKADDLIFEVISSSVEIPEGEALLHADCNEQEVVCELSRYNPRGVNPDSLPAFFIGSLQLEGGAVSHTLVLQTSTNEPAGSGESSLVQSKLQLPLSQWGTLITEAVFVVFTRSPSLLAPIGTDAVLDCGFKQKDSFVKEKVELEWRWQHRGHGKTILNMSSGKEETEEGMQIQIEREGASADSDLLIRDGNASLTLKKLKVSDEGAYICTVTSGQFQTQQIIQLHIIQPPTVFISEKELIFNDESPQKLSCHCDRYYPLDVQVEWFSQSPSQTESISLTKKSSLSSHRQHRDGTFSVSSFLLIRHSEHPPGTVFTCMVSHFALPAPSNVTRTLLTPEPAGGYYWMVLVTLVLSVLFLYQALT